MVFELNDEPTWNRVRKVINNFLVRLCPHPKSGSITRLPDSVISNILIASKIGSQT